MLTGQECLSYFRNQALLNLVPASWDLITETSLERGVTESETPKAEHVAVGSIGS
jgi:hypothetical protein